jgi:hypothetical protein
LVKEAAKRWTSAGHKEAFRQALRRNKEHNAMELVYEWLKSLPTALAYCLLVY